MYTPALFRNSDITEVKDLIKQNGFGILVSQVNSSPWATHIPMHLGKNAAGKDVLSGHVSKANPQWKDFSDNSTVLAIFQGAHSYISSSWYDHENVPTWNYIAAHVYGSIRIVSGEELVDAHAKLVDFYETGSAKPVSVEHMTPAFLQKQVNGIIGFEITISEIQSTYKLSQNRDETNHRNIIQQLEQKGNAQSLSVAAQMKKHGHK